MSRRPRSRTAGGRSGWRTRTATCSPWGSRALLRHVHADVVVAHRTAWIARSAFRLLHRTGAIGRAHDQVVRALLRRGPVEVPQDPGQLGQGGGALRFGPGGAAVGADLYLADAARAGVRDPTDGDTAHLHDVAIARHIEPRGRLHESVVVPALLLPIAAALVIDQVDLGQPLRSLHPVTAGDEDARGVAVGPRQLCPVELVRDEDRWVRVDHRAR